MEEVYKHAASRGSSSKKAKEFEDQFFRSQMIKSSLASLLIDLWAGGRIPATLVQQIAQAAKNDLGEAGYGKINEWEILSQLGSHGAHKNNVHRDLMRKLHPAAVMVNQRAVPVKVSPVKGSIGKVGMMRLPLVLPMDLWKSIWDCGNFDTYIVESVSRIQTLLVGGRGPPCSGKPPIRFPLAFSGLVDVTSLMRMLACMFIDLCMDL